VTKPMSPGKPARLSVTQPVSRICPGCKRRFVNREPRDRSGKKLSTSTICKACRSDPNKYLAARKVLNERQMRAVLRERREAEEGDSRASALGAQEPAPTIHQREAMVLKMLRGEW